MRLLILLAAFVLLAGATDAATYCRSVGGRLIDCYVADSGATLEARLGVSGFLVVPDGTRGGSTFTLNDGAVDTVTPPPDPPSPPRLPVVLSKIDFVRLVLSAGGASYSQLVAAHNDAALEAYWILLDLSVIVTRDAAETAAALAALDAGGYLPNHAAAVVAAWQTQ